MLLEDVAGAGTYTGTPPAPPPLSFGTPLASQSPAPSTQSPAPGSQPPAPGPQTPFIGGRLSDLPGYVPPDTGRALQPYQIEDRNAWLDNLLSPPPAPQPAPPLAAPAPAPAQPAGLAAPPGYTAPGPASPPPDASAGALLPSAPALAPSPSWTTPPPMTGATPLELAIDQGTPDPHVRLAMRMGALMEGGSLAGGWAPGDQGTSFGPYQIHLPAHPDMTAETAQNPLLAAGYMLPAYTQAVQQVPAALWQSDPAQAAAMAAFFAERPAQMYSPEQVQGAWMRLQGGLAPSGFGRIGQFGPPAPALSGAPATIAFNTPAEAAQQPGLDFGTGLPTMPTDPQAALQWATWIRAQAAQGNVTAQQVFAGLPDALKAAAIHNLQTQSGATAEGPFAGATLSGAVGAIGQAGEYAVRHAPLTALIPGVGPSLATSAAIAGQPQPTLGGAVGALPEHAGPVPVRSPAETALNLTGQLAGYGVADVLSGGTLMPLYVAAGAQNLGDTWQAYQGGQISGRQALLQVAETAPQLLIPLLHAAGPLADYARSPEGQTFLARLGEEKGKLRIPGTLRTVDHTDLAQAPSILEPADTGYHGTGSRFQAFDSDKMDTTALFGPGVYVTDDPNIARSYAEKRAAQVSAKSGEATGESTIQSVIPKPGLRVLNMERPLPPDAAHIYLGEANLLEEGDLVAEAIKRGAPGIEVARALRTAMSNEGLYTYEAGERLQDINDALAARGYDGITHKGGIQGGPAHTVTVIFNPDNVQVATPMTRALAFFRSETGGGKLPGGGGTPDNMFFRDEQGNRIPVGPERPTGAVNFPRPGAIGDVGPGGQPVVQGVAEPLPGSPPARGTGGDPVGDFLQREQARQDVQARQAFWRPGQESAPPGVGGPDVAGNALARLDSLRADQAAAEQDVHRTGEMIASRAKALGADPTHAAVVQRSFEDTARIVQNMPQEAAGKLATFATRVQGRFPGAFGVMADAKISLGNALRQTTSEWEAAHLPDIQKLYDKEAPGLTYAGPPKLADEIAASPNLKAYTVQTHPEQFPNMSPALRDAITEANNRLESTYKIAWITNPKYADPVEGNYLPQIWDTGTREVQPLPRPPGAASVTKGRAWKDWQQAYQSGVWPYKLKDMSISEYIHAGLEGTNRAIEDAIARAEILERYGSTVQAAGTVPFRNPMYAGWHADPQVVNFVDQMYEPAPGIVRELQGAMGAARNTAYFFDVPGIAMRLATGSSQSPKIFAALLNRALASAHLPNLELYSDPNLPHTVEANLAGVQQGLAGSPIRFEGGTIFKYVPGLNKLDARLSPLVKKATQVMWGNTLTPIGNLLYEGNLMALKLTGQDITDPAVKLKAAENANAFRGASLGAAKAGRREMEAFFLGSPQNTRAMFSQLGQVANILKVGDPASQVIAASTLASYAVSAWGLGSLINMKYGSGDPLEWNPLSRDFLTLKMNGVRIPLVPQRTLLSAITKSINDLATGDPQAIGSAWAQFGYSRLSPGARIPAALAGYGYGPGGFQAGGLPTSNRLLNAAPMPPSLAQLTERPSDFLNPTLEISRNLGFPAYPFSTPDARDAAAKPRGYQNYADAIAHGTRADVRAINADPAVQAAERAREDQATGALKGFYLRRDQINTQQSVSDRQLQAGQITGADWRAAYDKTEQEIHDAVRDYLSNMPSGNQDPLLQQYAAQGKQFVGADGRITDTQGYYNALDAWKASLSPADQQKLDNLLQPTGAQSPVVQEYRDTTQALQKAGWFDAEKNLLHQGGITEDSVAQWSDDWINWAMQEYASSIPAGWTPEMARQFLASKFAASPRVREIEHAITLARLQTVAGNKPLLREAIKFGLTTSKTAYMAAQ